MTAGKTADLDRAESLSWYLFDFEFQTPTHLEIDPSVARGRAANSHSVKDLGAARASPAAVRVVAERQFTVHSNSDLAQPSGVVIARNERDVDGRGSCQRPVESAA